MNVLLPIACAVVDLSDPLEALAERATGLAEGARAANTRNAYRSDWAHFSQWCAGHGLAALPAAPATVGLYLTAH